MHKRLEGQRIAPVDNPTDADISAALEKLDPKENAFLVLSAENGDFVQCAGAKDRLVVEWKSPQLGHFIVGRRSQDYRQATIECSVGPIHVQAREVLAIDDAKAIFLDYLRTGAVPDSYSLRRRS